MPFLGELYLLRYRYKELTKRVNQTELRPLSLEKLLCKFEPWALYLGTSSLGVFHPSLTDKNVSLCLKCANNMVCAEHLFSFRVYEVLELAKWRVPTCPASNTDYEHWVHKDLLWETVFHMCCLSLVLKDLSMICVNPLGEDFCRLPPGFLLALSHVSFPLADFAL